MMRNEEIIAIIESYRRDSLGADDNDLSSQRADAFDHYHGRPYGNEQEGRSQVVTKDLSETVDWVMAPMMKIFTSSDAVEFDPVGPEDEELAAQETEYTNHVIRKDNNYFMFTHDWFKDALLLKNGYVKHWWEEEEKITEDEYEELTEDQLTLLIMDLEAEAEKEGGEVKITAQEERQIQGPDPMMPPITIYDVKVETKMKVGRCRIEAVPAEEVRVSKRCRGSLQESPFVEHVTTKTRTELIEMGMDKDFVYTLAAFGGDDNDDVMYSRDSIDDESDNYDNSFSDRSMDEVEYCEAYVRIDVDGDGRAELRKIVTAGKRIPKGDEWNEVISSVPMTSISPKRVPHRHVGESLDDEIADLQEIHTTLMRQLLDNIYRTNNQQTIINDRANLPDFLQDLPGGVKRLEGDEPVTGHVMPVQHQPILNQILPAIDHINGMKENRTGINELNTNISPDILKQTNNAVMVEGIAKASQKVEMIARFFAEGMKELMLRVHEILVKHQDRERTVKLRGKYVTVNPQHWKERNDLTIKVGLGTGSEEEKRMKLMIVADLAERVGQAFGIVTPKHGYKLFTDVVETLGILNPEKYILDPESDEYKQMKQQQAEAAENQPNPLAEAEQIKAQANMQIAQINMQHKAEMEMVNQRSKQEIEAFKQQVEQENKLLELIAEMNNKAEDRLTKEDIAALEAEVKMAIEGMKADIGNKGIGDGVQEVARTFDPNTGAFL